MRQKTAGELRHREMVEKQKARERGKDSTASSDASPMTRLAQRILERTKTTDERQ
jgi:hypothetical protein